MIQLRAGRRTLPVDVVVTDLDRTLTDRRLRVQSATLEALRRARGRGARLVLATGRRLPELRARRRLLDMFDAVILEGGAMVGLLRRLRPLTPPGPQLERLKGWLGEARIHYRSGTASLSVPRAAGARLKRCPFRRLFAITPNRDRIDITLRGVNKGAALRSLRKRELRPLRGRVLCFGDGENDLPLFQASHYNVAVKNAVPKLLAAANEVTNEYGGRGVAAFINGRLLGGNGR